MAVEGRILGVKERSPTPAKGRSAEALARALPRLGIEARSLAAAVAAGVHGRRRAGQGDNFWQFRPLAAGESVQRIDWRRSARDDRTYVREREWEAAKTIWLAIDRSPSMAFVSTLAQASKLDRALVIGLALADLLVRGGERVGLLGLGAPVASRRVIERLSEQLVLAGETQPFAAINRRDEVIVITDAIAPLDEIEKNWSLIGQNSARGHVVLVADPAEDVFPFEGETEFLDPESEARLSIGDAASFKERYLERLAAHREGLRLISSRRGWSMTLHRTDKPAAELLLALSGRLAHGEGA
jgi:uncharacterized protein (DUF58 family)